jgi:hypothetical protein
VLVKENSHHHEKLAHATNNFAHAEGNGTTASGAASHAEGQNTKALKNASHAEGGETKADGQYAHAEGYKSIAESGWGAHAEGGETLAKGNYSHAEGYNTQANGEGAHSEGRSTKAIGNASHAEGRNCIAGRKKFNVTYVGGSIVSNITTLVLDSVEGVSVGDELILHVINPNPTVLGECNLSFTVSISAFAHKSRRVYSPVKSSFDKSTVISVSSVDTLNTATSGLSSDEVAVQITIFSSRYACFPS